MGPRSSGDVARAAAIRPFNGVKLGAQFDVTHLREPHLGLVVGSGESEKEVGVGMGLAQAGPAFNSVMGDE